ncbi:MAG: helix-turn-helix domain-containing protein [Solirubrobacteraceae bacterium]
MSQRVAVRVGASGAALGGRQLGARLRELRDGAGLTGAEVARRMGRAHSTLSRWESGGLLPRTPDVYFMLDLYGVRDAERDGLLRSVENVRARHDWEVDVAVEVADYARMESRAWKVEEFQDSVVPGLLQTPEYARAVLRAWDPAATPQQLERWVGVRMTRQRRLADEDPLQLVTVIGEGALRRPVGGPQVMRAQLKHLVDLATQPNIEVRLLPLAAAHAGMTSSFIVLRLRDEQDVATTATPGGEIYFDDVEPFALTLRRLAAAALAQRKSAATIAAMRREFT